jgi:hypothetical protein
MMWRGSDFVAATDLMYSTNCGSLNAMASLILLGGHDSFVCEGSPVWLGETGGACSARG